MSIPLLTRVAVPVYTEGTADGTENVCCGNCAHMVVLNYDGPGSGWSHIYPEGSVNVLRSGMKECATMNEEVTVTCPNCSGKDVKCLDSQAGEWECQTDGVIFFDTRCTDR